MHLASSSRRPWILAGLIAAAALFLLATAVPQSEAGSASPKRNGSGGCANGDVCLWGLDSYQGCWKDMNNDQDVYGGITWANCPASIDNGANSIKNRGDCNVRMFEGPNKGGQQITFDSRFGGTNNDPDLSNGGGASGNTGQNWQNRISSHNFCV